MIVLLDTDHFTILQMGAASGAMLNSRLAKLTVDDVKVPIVTFQEQTQGWLSFINRARKRDQYLRGFFFLRRLLRDYRYPQVLPFDEAAMDEFESLQHQRIRIGTNDLRIAAIAIANDVKLLSRNLRDFRQVPNLDVADWTV